MADAAAPKAEAPAATAAAAAAAAAAPADKPTPVLKEGGDEVMADCMASLSGKLFRKVVRYV